MFAFSFLLGVLDDDRPRLAHLRTLHIESRECFGDDEDDAWEDACTEYKPSCHEVQVGLCWRWGAGPFRGWSP